MTGLFAPMVFFLCAHCHENDMAVAAHGWKRWQVTNDSGRWPAESMFVFKVVGIFVGCQPVDIVDTMYILLTLCIATCSFSFATCSVRHVHLATCDWDYKATTATNHWLKVTILQKKNANLVVMQSDTNWQSCRKCLKKWATARAKA